MMAKDKSMVMGTRFVPGFVCRDLNITREISEGLDAIMPRSFAARYT